MNSTFKPLLIIGAIVVIGVGGIIGYVVTQNKDNDHSSMQEHTGSDHQAAADAEATDMVAIKNYAFSPAAIKVKVGTKVTWTNQDDVGHTVTSDDGAPASIDSKVFNKGESFSYTFDKAGTYTYHCQPHPYMKGTVIVTE